MNVKDLKKAEKLIEMHDDLSISVERISHQLNKPEPIICGTPSIKIKLDLHHPYDDAGHGHSHYSKEREVLVNPHILLDTLQRQIAVTESDLKGLGVELDECQ